MIFAVTPSESDIQAVLRSFLASILPAGIEIVEGQDNRVPEPIGTDFVVLTALRRRRIETNEDDFVDTAFTGSINGTLMTVTSLAFGSLGIGSPIFGSGVLPNSAITALGSGTGGAGTYTVSPAQTIAEEALAAGVFDATQATEITFQLDVHGPNSADNAQAISTLFRDDFAVEAFAALNGAVAPLYADDPRQAPFLNDQQQIEYRWVVEAVLQANQTIVVPQQFFDAAVIGVISVDATYPP